MEVTTGQHIVTKDDIITKDHPDITREIIITDIVNNNNTDILEVILVEIIKFKILIACHSQRGTLLILILLMNQLR